MLLEVHDVSKDFGTVPALRNVSLAVEDGEFVTLLGPSGSGKSTLLRIIAGFVRPSSGNIVLRGKSVNTTPPYLRNVPLVFQSYALFPHLTVYENIAFGLKVRRTPQRELSGRVDEMLEIIQLSGYDHRFPHQLSGGQQQRVAVARALAIRPDLLLLDEPLSNLDARLKEHMRAELKSLLRKMKVGSINVTHDQADALEMSDRIAVLNEGRLEQIGTGAELYRQPRSEFVAKFLGNSNVFRGIILAANKQSVLVDVGNVAKCRARTTPAREWRPHEHVSVCIRPSHVHVRIDRSKAENSLEAIVEECLFGGNSMKVLAYVLEGQRMWVERPIGSHKEPEYFELGQRIFLEWDIDAVWLIPLQSGEVSELGGARSS